jgi:hypothetical protein
MAGPTGSGVDGQITHVQIDGVDAFVRENFRCDTFMMSSGERKGTTINHVPGQQVLELATAGDFKTIATTVCAADSKHRPVINNRNWTVNVAKRLFADRGVR